MSSFWNEYPEIEYDLDNIMNIIVRNMKSADKVFQPALLDLAGAEGKLLRPAFVMLAGRFGTTAPKTLYKLGAAIEMVHMASLIHDDIIDEAKLRRGKPTTQAKYGKKLAVLMGDYLFCRCFILLSEDTSMSNMKRVSKVIAWICTGEMRQLSTYYNLEVNMREYLKRIAAKTAALFAASFYIGAVQSGCSILLSRKLAKVGYSIGMAFQIIDDILDYQSNEAVLGKEAGHDLRQGVFTIPLIYALEKDNGTLRAMLSVKNMGDEEIAQIIDLVDKSGGIQKARDHAKRYTDKAFDHIRGLPENDGKVILYNVANTLLIREY